MNNSNLISKDQSCFRPGDSNINQLISITSSIFESFENFEETRALFLDISKAFDGCHSDWKIIEAGVPQGSVLGPLLFLVYINDLPDNILANMKLFADDSSLFNRVFDVNITHSLLENDLTTIQHWANQRRMVFNPDITKQAIEIVFSVKNNKPIHTPFRLLGNHFLTIWVYIGTKHYLFQNTEKKPRKR